MKSAQTQVKTGRDEGEWVRAETMSRVLTLKTR